MIRAFVAVDLEAQTVQKIAEATGRLRSRIVGIRWLQPDNFHLTLKFLGDVDESKIESMASALQRELGPFSRFVINAKGLGVFPDLKRPRILWVGLASDDLSALASKVEKALIPFGFPAEKRTFAPHLTVGRWREFRGSAQELAAILEEWRGHEFGPSTVDEVILFQSVLRPEGAVYRRLKSVALV